jgi:hypothetical protein
MDTRATQLMRSLRESNIELTLILLNDRTRGREAIQRVCSQGVDALFMWAVGPFNYIRWMEWAAKRLLACQPSMRTILVADDAFVSLRKLSGTRPTWSEQERLRWIHSCSLFRFPGLASDETATCGVDGAAVRAVASGATSVPSLSPMQQLAVLTAAEFQMYDAVDGVFAITRDTMLTLRKLVRETPMAVLPYVSPTLQESSLGCKLRPAAVPSASLVGDNNTGNVDGLRWLAQGVLPRLPSGFVMHVVGRLSGMVRKRPEMRRQMCRAPFGPPPSSQKSPACLMAHGMLPYSSLARIICRASAAVNPSLEPAGISTKSILSLSLGSQVVTSTYDGTFPTGEAHPPFVRMCTPRDDTCFAAQLMAAAQGGKVQRMARERGPLYVQERFGKSAFDIALQRMFDRLGVLCD